MDLYNILYIFIYYICKELYRKTTIYILTGAEAFTQTKPGAGLWVDMGSGGVQSAVYSLLVKSVD